MLRLGIVTPSYNQGSFLDLTLDSVLLQPVAGPPIVHWVVDGGSRDDTVQRLKQRHAEPRLRWVSERDKGQADAVNKGIQRLLDGADALGPDDIIGWLNSDDLYRPGALATVQQYLQENPKIDIAWGEGDYVDAQGGLLRRFPSVRSAAELARELPRRCCVSQPSVFFRRRVVDRIGLLNADLHYTLDYEYWLRCLEGGCTFGYLPQVLSGARLHDSCKSVGGQDRALNEVVDLLHRRYGAVPPFYLMAEACQAAQLSGTSVTAWLTKGWLLPIHYLRRARHWHGRLRLRDLPDFCSEFARKLLRRRAVTGQASA